MSCGEEMWSSLHGLKMASTMKRPLTASMRPARLMLNRARLGSALGLLSEVDECCTVSWADGGETCRKVRGLKVRFWLRL